MSTWTPPPSRSGFLSQASPVDIHHRAPPTYQPFAPPLHSPIRSSQVKLQDVTRLFNGHWHYSMKLISLGRKTECGSVPSLFISTRRPMDLKWGRVCSATESNEIVTQSSDADSSDIIESVADDQFPSPDAQPSASNLNKTSSTQSKRASLTAREKLRAARVLSRYAESKPSKSQSGSKILDASRESDKGKRKAGLPEAPVDLFDDGKRGLPKPGWTFDFPGGSDLLVIAFSFVFISTVMFATTYIVWKVGAIHFNEY